MKPPKYYGLDRPLRDLRPADMVKAKIVLPQGAGLNHQCTCGELISLPWDKQSPEFAPSEVTINGRPYIQVPRGITVRCKSCGLFWVIQRLPKKERSDFRFTVYGDESYHTVNDQTLYTYAMVAQVPNAALDQLQITKHLLRPETPPADWVLHTYDVRSPRWRAENGISLGSGEVNELLRTLARSLDNEETLIFVSVSGYDSRAVPDIREDVLSYSIHITAENLTEIGCNVSYVLESTNRDPDAKFIDKDIERISRGLFCSPSFLQDCHGMHVALPVTVAKNPTPELELADFVAFWTNRYFYRRSKNQESEVPLTAFGSMVWNMPRGKGFHTNSAIGFPYSEWVVPPSR